VRRGYSYIVTREQIRKYASLTPKQKLDWLQEANDFVNKFISAKSRSIQKKFRRGDI
jgi:hypothetical protein